MADIWTMGEILVEIMRPRAGMQLFEPGEFIGPLPSGAPAIFIDTAARLGASAGIIGGVGRDDFGKNVIDRLKKDGVDCHQVAEVDGRSTAVAFVTYFEDGSRKFVFHIDGTPAVMKTFDPSMDAGTPKFFHVMGCSLMANDRFRESIFDAVRYFHRKGAAISFDPNIRPELLGGRSTADLIGPVMDACRVLLPGVGELKMLAGAPTVEESVHIMFDKHPIEIIVLKNGKKGATIYTRSETVEVPVYPITEVDPTGAGDAFDAGFLCGLLQGKALAECGRIASAAGALNAAAFGPMEGIINPHSIEKMMAGVN